jgi:hypothetical protein
MAACPAHGIGELDTVRPSSVAEVMHGRDHLGPRRTMSPASRSMHASGTVSGSCAATNTVVRSKRSLTL